MSKDQGLRRFILKPMVRRTSLEHGAEALAQSLSRLAQRAYAGDMLSQLKDVVTSRQEPKQKNRWKNHNFAFDLVQLAKALFLAGRISRAEFVYYSMSAVEGVHEGRWFDGHYKADLDPISDQLDDIERRHGLKKDEFWTRSSAPSDHRALSQRYEETLASKFGALLREFDLHELALTWENDRPEINRLRERGRRSVHHPNETAAALMDVVVRYEIDATRAASAQAYTAAITLLGAGLEGLLLLRCLKSPRKAERVSASLPRRLRPRDPKAPTKWTFETLIETNLAAGWLPVVSISVAELNPAALAHALRSMRNNVHPGRFVTNRPWSEADEGEYLDAKAIYVALLSAMSQKAKRSRGVSHLI